VDSAGAAEKWEGEGRLGVIRAKDGKKGKTIIAEKEKRRRRGRRVREKEGKKEGRKEGRKVVEK